MIRLKKQNVLYDWGGLLFNFFFDSIAKRCIYKPNQKSMVECFCKNS